MLFFRFVHRKELRRLNATIIDTSTSVETKSEQQKTIKNKKRVHRIKQHNKQTMFLLCFSFRIAPEECKKPFCRFGCVCDSINTDHTISVHCQELKCMFDCNCTDGDKVQSHIHIYKHIHSKHTYSDAPCTQQAPIIYLFSFVEYKKYNINKEKALSFGLT